MWNVKTKVIPVIIGTTETISKSFRKSENSYIRHCAHTAEGANVEMESSQELAICAP